MSVHAHKSMHNCTYANIPAYRNKHNTCSLSETTLKITTKNNQVGNNNHETDQKNNHPQDFFLITYHSSRECKKRQKHNRQAQIWFIDAHKR